MKYLLLLLLLLLLLFGSCSVKKEQCLNELYIYFNRNDNDMIKYNNWKEGPVTYLFKTENNNILFTPLIHPLVNDNQPYTLNYNIEDTDFKNLDLKEINWLKKITNNGLELNVLDKYKYINIVEIDSVRKRAIISQSINIIEIE